MMKRYLPLLLALLLFVSCAKPPNTNDRHTTDESADTTAADTYQGESNTLEAEISTADTDAYSESDESTDTTAADTYQDENDTLEAEISAADTDAYLESLEHLKSEKLMQMFRDAEYESIGSDTKERNRQYEKIIQHFTDNIADYAVFGGGYLQNGYLHIMLTDSEYTEALSELLNMEYILTHNCQHNYDTLFKAWKIITADEYVTSYVNYYIYNCIRVTVAQEAHREALLLKIEEEGLPSDTVRIDVTDVLFEIPV